MPVLQLESSIEKKFVKEARKLGCMTRKLEGIGQGGWPDQLILIPHGPKLLIEFKRPGGVLSPIQEACHEDAEKIGHQFYVFDNWQEAIALVKGLL